MQDDEIVLDICACLITLLQDHPELSNLILELGFISKLRENLEASHVPPAVYELSLLVLCAILRGSSILHRTMVLRVNSNSGTVSVSGNGSYGSSSVCNHGHGGAGTSAAMSFSASEAPMSVFSFDSAATQGEGEGEGALVMPTTYQPGMPLFYFKLCSAM